jgi:4-hydroxy-tetrahydrodipicolinate synthase
MADLRGILTAMATPFTADGAVDEAATRDLARFLLENGSHGIVAAATTGESTTLDDGEHIGVLRTVFDEIGGEGTIVCGTGTNDTRHTIELTKAAADAGAEAALVVTPYYNKPNPAGVRAHFEAVANAVPELPIVVYNIPSRVIVNISPAELAALAEIDNVVALKQANNDDLGAIEGMAVLSGNDDIFLRTLELGLAGGITVASHVVGPQMREIWDAVEAGDLETARAVEDRIRPVYEALSLTTNPMPVKAALELAGTIPSGTLRLPMVEVTEGEREQIRTALESAGVAVTAG